MNCLEIKSMNVFIELNGLKTYVIGGPCSGKTYMLKKIMNRIDNGDVFLDNKNIKEYDVDFLKRNIVVVLNDNNFNTDTVKEELLYYVKELKLDIKFDNFINFFSIDSLLDESIEFLRLEDKIMIKILSLLIINPKIICIDSMYEYLPKKYIKLLNQFIKNNNINLINVINNLEYLDLDSNIVVLNKKQSIYCGDTLSVLKGNTILPYMGFKLPFIIDLSQNLVLYELIDDVNKDAKKVVDQLWK